MQICVVVLWATAVSKHRSLKGLFICGVVMLSHQILRMKKYGNNPPLQAVHGRINCQLAVRLAACRFDSPAAFYLFVSARTPHPTPHSPSSALLKNPSLHLTCPLASLICWTRMWPSLGPNRRYCLPPFLACSVCDPHQLCCVFFLIIILFIIGPATYCKWQW